ncbi:subtilisin-chymotrypsin inhibitor CI-1A-like [Pyrus ussuriensis x Pyrus communis]|uniref:Subtilisin-chymotrypsin inhibitor CI-1A-like n=1 Tax=Pyrus ussuriensis x Pyrus communis TaxID=2448454 RepID=A0A5N5F9J8_9ROSA|nr:subtilisin-chymotrypsin inhibitor CI-1A-like [Pyrus ussuriensis x Pyrus communis]
MSYISLLEMLKGRLRTSKTQLTSGGRRAVPRRSLIAAIVWRVGNVKGSGLRYDDSRGGAGGGYPSGKSSWPELVGTRGEEAVAIIIKENPSVRAHTIYLYTMNPPSFCALTQDLRFNRVLVFIDQRCLVALPPKIG